LVEQADCIPDERLVLVRRLAVVVM